MSRHTLCCLLLLLKFAMSHYHAYYWFYLQPQYKLPCPSVLCMSVEFYHCWVFLFTVTMCVTEPGAVQQSSLLKSEIRDRKASKWRRFHTIPATRSLLKLDVLLSSDTFIDRWTDTTLTEAWTVSYITLEWGGRSLVFLMKQLGRPLHMCNSIYKVLPCHFMTLNSWNSIFCNINS